MAHKSIDVSLNVADVESSLPRFANYPEAASKGIFKPNPNFWASHADFSCASPWNSAGGSQRAGTLSSPRHIIFAKHFPLWEGVRILFVGSDGVVCSRHIEKTKDVHNTDIMIGLLNFEVTPNIHPAQILPGDADKYIGRGEGLPVVTFNKEEKLFLTELDLMPTNGSPIKWQGSHIPSSDVWKRFREQLIGGDSGNPSFLLICNQPILLYCLKSGGCGAGPPIHCYRKEIQDVMNELCLGYKLKSFDFKSLKCRRE